eukprot:scaffold916_cov516-Prasinococcus_capsulatus_cf.AAC.30
MLKVLAHVAIADKLGMELPHWMKEASVPVDEVKYRAQPGIAQLATLPGVAVNQKRKERAQQQLRSGEGCSLRGGDRVGAAPPREPAWLSVRALPARGASQASLRAGHQLVSVYAASIFAVPPSGSWCGGTPSEGDVASGIQQDLVYLPLPPAVQGGEVVFAGHQHLLCIVQPGEAHPQSMLEHREPAAHG